MKSEQESKEDMREGLVDEYAAQLNDVAGHNAETSYMQKHLNEE